MPEGPEIRTSCLFVNQVCSDVTFTGKPEKSAVSKNPEISFTSPEYSISSESRGKEVALRLMCSVDSNNTTRILFRFGMSGKFYFTPAKELRKHSHLVFYTKSTEMALSFVDARRFGTWNETEEWGSDRGPDPILEYQLFRDNILGNLDSSVFNKPICEVMLNQKYFNGIGNYLRAEILYRAKIPPFTAAREAISQLQDSKDHGDTIGKPVHEFLYLCHQVPMEVLDLKIGLGKTKVAEVNDDDYTAYFQWLQCYENPDMNNLVDHNNRTIWFQGNPGPLAPKVKKSRGRKRKLNASTNETKVDKAKSDKQLLPDDDNDDETVTSNKPVKKRRKINHQEKDSSIKGNPGPLAPKVKKSRGRKRKLNEAKFNEAKSDEQPLPNDDDKTVTSKPVKKWRKVYQEKDSSIKGTYRISTRSQTKK